jgi:pimeloyl-ACP methyl ester carboxylesterase
VRFVEGPRGPLEYLVTGGGRPVTLFAHGFAGSIAETRPFGSGVSGTRVFFHFRGHGQSGDGNGPWTYAALAAELRTVRLASSATRALGVSLGAGAVISAAVSNPEAFERLVLVLPAAVHEPRRTRALDRVEAMARRADADDVDGLTSLLLEALPAALCQMPAVRGWAFQQAQRLADPRLRGAIRQVPTLHPVDDLSALAAIGCPVLVVGQRGDDAHPVQVVRELSEALPDVRTEVFPPGGVPWTSRADLRRVISTFLNQ